MKKIIDFFKTTIEWFKSGTKMIDSDKSFMKSMLSDVDGTISSKRTVLIWVGIVLWSWVHWQVFHDPKLAAERIAVINDDYWLILGSAGIVLAEKFTNRGIDSPSNSNGNNGSAS